MKSFSWLVFFVETMIHVFKIIWLIVIKKKWIEVFGNYVTFEQIKCIYTKIKLQYLWSLIIIVKFLMAKIPFYFTFALHVGHMATSFLNESE